MRNAWSEHVVRACFVIVALIHLMPLVGLLGREMLNRAYGTSVDDPRVLTLLTHRALVFGLLGGLGLWAAWQPPRRAVVGVVLGISAAGFVVVAWLHHHSLASLGTALLKVVVADVVAVLLLLIAWAVTRASSVGA